MSAGSAGPTPASRTPAASPRRSTGGTPAALSPSVLINTVKALAPGLASPFKPLVASFSEQMSAARAVIVAAPAPAPPEGSGFVGKTFASWEDADHAIRKVHLEHGRALRVPDSAKDPERAKGFKGNVRVLVCRSDVCKEGRIVVRKRVSKGAGQLDSQGAGKRAFSWEVTEDTLKHEQCPTTAKQSTSMLVKDPTVRANVLAGSGMTLSQTQVLISSAANIPARVTPVQASRVRVKIVEEELKDQQAEYALLPGLLREIVSKHKGGASLLRTKSPEGVARLPWDTNARASDALDCRLPSPRASARSRTQPTRATWSSRTRSSAGSGPNSL
jgi:hypothetical protein